MDSAQRGDWPIIGVITVTRRCCRQSPDVSYVNPKIPKTAHSERQTLLIGLSDGKHKKLYSKTDPLATNCY